MFCVFLENTPPKEDLLITINHNGNIYKLSRDLSLKHSYKLSNLITQENTIDLDYDHEYDDFQLISDLFNYKRVFINQLNIEYLDFISNHLQIPILIKKVQKYKNQYHHFLENPIFKEIKKLRNQIFSLGQSSSFDDNSDYDDNADDEDITYQKTNDNNSTTDKGNDTDNTKIDNNNNNSIQSDRKEDGIKNDTDINSNTNQDNDEINNKTTQDQINTNKSQSTESNATNNKQISNEEKKDKIPHIEYKDGYETTVTHILISAIIADPLNSDLYFEIIRKDKKILQSFVAVLRKVKLLKNLAPILEAVLFQASPSDYRYVIKTTYQNTKLDTNLEDYLNKAYQFYNQFFNQKISNEYIISIIKIDDIESLQKMYISHDKIFKEKSKFKLFFQISMVACSIKCFKYFLLNVPSLFNRFQFTYQFIQPSVIGGSTEIFRMLIEKYSGTALDFIKDAIFFQKSDILKWIISNNVQFLSLYNSCCSVVLYGINYVLQKWYTCTKCYSKANKGCCKFCAKHCHLNDGGTKRHNPKFDYISSSCYCDDDCQLSKNIELVGEKKFVEIDDLILLAIFCCNTRALKILIDEGGYIVRCRDRATKEDYIMLDARLKELIENLPGYKSMSEEEISSKEKESQATPKQNIDKSKNKKEEEVDENENENINDNYMNVALSDVAVNICNVDVIQTKATEMNDSEALCKVSEFRKRVNDVSEKVNKSATFNQLVEIERLVFNWCISNKDESLKTAKTICSSSSSVCELAHAITYALLYRASSFDVINEFVNASKCDSLKYKVVSEIRKITKKKRNLLYNDILTAVERNLQGRKMRHTTVSRAIQSDDIDKLRFFFDAFEGTDELTLGIDIEGHERLMLDSPENHVSFVEYAMFCGSPKCFSFLHGEMKHEINKKDTKYALCGGNAMIIDECLKVNEARMGDIAYAIKFNRFEAFKKLFTNFFSQKSGLFEKVQKKLCLTCIKFSSFRILRFLIESGADVNDCLIHKSLNFRNFLLFEFLIGLNIDVNKKDSNGLAVMHWAIRQVNLRAVEMIISKNEKKLDINATDNEGRAPIHYAAIVGNIDIFKSIMKVNSINLNALTNDKMSALTYSYLHHNHDVFMLILENDLIDVNTHDVGLWTLLHYAVYFNDKETVELLLKKEKTNPNELDNVLFIFFFFMMFYFLFFLYNASPLLCACENQNIEIVLLLLAHPLIDINTCDVVEFLF